MVVYHGQAVFTSAFKSEFISESFIYIRSDFLHIFISDLGSIWM